MAGSVTRLLIAVCVSASVAAGDQPARGQEANRHEQIDRAIIAARKYLASQIGADGRCAGEYPPDNPRFGGKTALCVYALLEAGADRSEGPLAAGLKWLSGAKLHGTYAVALRACAWSALTDPAGMKLLTDDVAWLVRAANRDGGYSYTAQAGRTAGRYDNSNSQMAVMGVWAAARRGIEVPAGYWQKVERHWLAQQQVDGGWPYFTRPGIGRNKTYGSMTAAGLATLYICFDNLHREQFIRCTASSEHKGASNALKWLTENYSVRANPRLGLNRYYYWLYSLQRAGLASGRKYIAGHDWYAEGAAELLARRNDDGSWGYGDRTAQTAFAMLFLVHGRTPVLLNKLRYRGRWNSRPRDLANLTRWLGYVFERPVNWQIVDIDSPLADWRDAPILYISGAGPVEFTDEQIGKLRTFALRGGLILSEAACNNGDFTLDIRKTYDRMFPRWRLDPLDEKHPIYNLRYRPAGAGGLFGASNGARLLGIHSPRQLSLALQLGPSRTRRPWFELLANIYLFATDKGLLRPRGSNPWPAAKAFAPAATIRLARLKYKGNYDPEPLALERLAAFMANRYRIKLIRSEPTDIAELDAAAWPVAHMTGTGRFTLTPVQRAGIKKYLAAGGSLVIDAAGGSKTFADSVAEQIVPLVGGGQGSRLALREPLYRAVEPIAPQVRYRRWFAAALGDRKHQPRLRGFRMGDRLAVIYSPDDLTVGLLGCQVYNIRGYAPQTAAALMTNILCYVSGVKLR